MKFVSILLIAFMMSPLSAGGEREYTPMLNSRPSYLQPEEASSDARSISQILYSLGNLYAYLDRSFLDEIDTDRMETELISAMIDSLGDQYSYYIPPDSAEASRCTPHPVRERPFRRFRRPPDGTGVCVPPPAARRGTSGRCRTPGVRLR